MTDPRRVVLVEDEKDRVREFWRALLTDDGSGRVRAAPRGRADLELGDRIDPHVVFVCEDDEVLVELRAQFPAVADRMHGGARLWRRPERITAELDALTGARAPANDAVLLLWDDQLWGREHTLEAAIAWCRDARARRLAVTLIGVTAYPSHPRPAVVAALKDGVLTDLRARERLDEIIGEAVTGPPLEAFGWLDGRRVEAEPTPAGAVPSWRRRLEAAVHTARERDVQADPVASIAFLVEFERGRVAVFEHAERAAWHDEKLKPDAVRAKLAGAPAGEWVWRELELPVGGGVDMLLQLVAEGPTDSFNLRDDANDHAVRQVIYRLRALLRAEIVRTDGGYRPPDHVIVVRRP